jgi:glutathione S-transferase
MRSVLLLILSVAVAVADPKPGDEGTPEYKKATELVKQLGDKRYTVREAAAKKLVEMGPGAVVALTEGTKSTDEEIRTRSVALLPQAKAAEWKRRAAAYLADTDGKQKHDLPLLSEWEKLVGKIDAGSRKLFAEMVRTNGEMLEQVAADRKKTQSICTARCKIVLAQVRTAKAQIKAELGDVAAILFVDSLSPTQHDWSSRTSPAYLAANPTVIDTMDAEGTGPVLRRLIVKWVEAHPARDHIVCQRFAMLVQKKPFAEAAPPLAKMAKDKNADALSIRLLAIQSLGKVGGKEAAATLAELVPETTHLFGGGGFGNGNDYTIGDAALAASLKMHGKKLSDFGINNQGGIGFGTGDGDEIISLELYGFNTADGRAKAVKKWKEEVHEKREETKDGKEAKKEEKKKDEKK